jgi:hypothetical protein
MKRLFKLCEDSSREAGLNAGQTVKQREQPVLKRGALTNSLARRTKKGEESHEKCM